MSEKTQTWLILMAMAAYVMFPIDLLPDALPILGTADDFLAMFYGMHKYVTLKQAR